MTIEELLNEIKPNYTGVVDVAKHCDKEKLKIAEDNAREYDMTFLCAEIDADIVQDEDDEIIKGGLVGGLRFGGLNKIFSYYAYARYVENSIYVDTGSGFVRKDHSNSFPVSLDELKDIANEHRRFAAEQIRRLKAYICKRHGGACECNTDLCGNAARPTLMSRKGVNISRR